MAGYTYTTLRQAIIDFTDNDEAVFLTQIDNFIRNAEERILHDAELEVFRKNATTTLQAGDKYLSKPSDWLFSYSMSIQDGGEYSFLLNKDVNFLQDFWPDPVDSDKPRYYADYDVSSFLIAPTPDASYSCELHYFYRPESITVSADETSWLGTNAGSALLYASLVEAYTFMKGMQDMLVKYEEMYTKAVSKIRVFAKAAEGLDAYRRPSA